MPSATQARPRMQITQRFLDALAALERQRSVEPMVEVFSDAARLSRLGRPAERGREGARRFWQEYREQFGVVESEFSRLIEAQEVVTLEWKTEGEVSTSHRISYTGVSVFEFAADEITDFRTYYDSAAFLGEPPVRG